MERFARIAAQALSQVLQAHEKSPLQAADLETPPDPKLGDFGYPCFRLAKEFRKGPPQVAAQLVAELAALPIQHALPPSIKAVAVGPYVNFTVDPTEILRTLLVEILAGPGLGEYGKLPAASRGKWVLEYSSPNVAKPLNIYHLRPTALGAALDRIGRFRGYQVTSINHLGDWGKQYGMLAVGFKHFGIPLDRHLSMSDLVDLYVKINGVAKKEPDLKLGEKARDAFLKLENGDPEITALWQKCVAVSLTEFDRIYKRIGVKFDYIWGESFYKDQLAPLLEKLKREDLLVESEGAWIVPVTDKDGRELTPCIMQKSDGATIYATRDVAAAIYRHEKFDFDRMTYIVGSEQRLHFQQVFGVLRKMKQSWADACEHVPTGLYRFKDAKMSTRDGNYVTLEEVLSLAKSRVSELMEARAKNIPEGAPPGTLPTEQITEAVAIGAVIFHDLSTDPARDVEFDIERVVDFEGETGPYLQYAHTRCQSILRKAQEVGGFSTDFDGELISKLGAPEEIALVKTLGMFPLHLDRTLQHAKASQLAHYLIDLTQAFGLFYRECRVLGDDPDLSRARVMLVEATRRILAQGMGLMLIPIPDRM